MKAGELGKRLGVVKLSQLMHGQMILDKLNALLPEDQQQTLSVDGYTIERLAATNQKLSRINFIGMDSAISIINELSEIKENEHRDKTISFRWKNIMIGILTGLMIICTLGVMGVYAHQSASNGHNVDPEFIKALFELIKLFLSVMTSA